MSLTTKQKQALDTLKQGFNVFLSGEGGTGKSYVIEQFTSYLEENEIPYVVAAPTGLAALNVGGATLHRTFKLETDFGSEKINLKNVERAKVIIIDEISMCRRDIFQLIARALKEFENPLEEYDIKKERKICRKKQIVLVGDFFQLPPFLGDNDKKALDKIKKGEMGDKVRHKDLLNIEQTIYPFQCDEWEAFNFKNIVLNEVVRQSDKDYIDNLNKIRRGDEEGLKFIKKESAKEEIKQAIYLTSRNKAAEDLNDKNLAKIKERAYTYRAEENGIVADSEKPVQEHLTLKKGARVMCVVNIQDKDKKKNNEEEEELTTDGIVNGMCGTVVKLNEESVTVKFDNGEIFKFEKYTWNIKGFKKIKVKEDGEMVEKTMMSEIGSYKQIPLKLAWAITIHKSQGQSYDSVNLDPACFAEGQLYVALSRAKNIKKLYLTKPLRRSYLKTSDIVKEFYEKIEQEQQKDFIEMDFKQVFEDKKVVETTKIQEKKTLPANKKAKNQLVENFKKEGIGDFTVEEEYVLMKIPKSLEKVVERVLNGDIDINNNVEEIKALQSKINRLEADLEKANRRRSKISKDKEKEILEFRKKGLGMNKIAKLVGVGDGTVRRVLKDYDMK